MIIASDFGNLETFVITVPMLLVALLAGLIGALIRKRWLILSASGMAFAAAAFLFLSLLAIDERDRADTQYFGAGATGLGLLILLGLLLPRR